MLGIEVTYNEGVAVLLNVAKKISHSSSSALGVNVVKGKREIREDNV